MSERWRQALGFPLYEVSDRGRVRHARIGRVRLGKMRHGHITVYLAGGGASGPGVPVAALMLRAFVGPKAVNGCRPAYRDGDPRNLSLRNLYWAPRSSRRLWEPGELRTVTRQRHALSADIGCGLAMALASHRLSLNEIARRAGLSRPTVMNAVRRDGCVNLATLVQLAAGLGMRGSELLAMAEKVAAVMDEAEAAE
jgi:hypothetical protein